MRTGSRNLLPHSVELPGKTFAGRASSCWPIPITLRTRSFGRFSNVTSNKTFTLKPHCSGPAEGRCLVDEARLAEYLSTQTGEAVAVHGSRRIGSGYSRVSYAVESSAGRFIVRVEQGRTVGAWSSDELRVMQWLERKEFPVARARWFEPTGAVLGKQFVVIDDLGVQPVDEQAVDEAAATAFVKTLASVHRLGVPSHISAADPEQATHAQIEHWRNVGKSAGGPRVPLLDAAEIWLHQNVPVDKRLALVHGAPRPSNMLIADGAVVAMTDWHMAHVGDPAEDWSYSLSMRDMPHASRQLWIGLFERESGVRMGTDKWDYWEAFNAYKVACINRSCLALFESGQDSSPAMAIAGTEQYHSLLLRLLHIVG
jgi:aminoglycoside phosphotransferase (APT) family kinase protein